MRRCCNNRNSNTNNNYYNSSSGCGCNLYNTNNLFPRYFNNSCSSEFDECECGFSNSTEEVFTQNPMYGHAYVPNQKMGNIFNQNCGLNNGTIFPELVSPYSPNDSVIENEYLESNIIESGCRNNGL